MRILIDSHILIWMIGQPQRLGRDAALILKDPANTIYVSAASIWEIAIKMRLGKLEFPIDEIAAIMAEKALEELAITMSDAVQAGALPQHHRDPFDRMLVAQATGRGLSLMTADQELAVYDVEIISAV